MQEHNRQVIEEDEIDLRELFATIWQGKKFIGVHCVHIDADNFGVWRKRCHRPRGEILQTRADS